MPAYNAALTLRETHREVMEQNLMDRAIVVDDASQDHTPAIAGALEMGPGLQNSINGRGTLGGPRYSVRLV